MATTLEFAVVTHVLTYLAGAGDGGSRPISSDELARSTNANPVYIRRALGPLREAGLVSSTSGARGGWRLARAADRITLADVWELVQGDAPVLGLHGASPQCPVGAAITRALQAIDRDVAGAVAAELATTTIADLLRGAGLPAALLVQSPSPPPGA